MHNIGYIDHKKVIEIYEQIYPASAFMYNNL